VPNGDPLTHICRGIVAAAAVRDSDLFRRLLVDARDAVPAAEPQQITGSLVILAPLLAEIPMGIGADLARLIGAMAGRTPDPAVILPILVERAATTMELAARFVALHSAELGDPPDPDDPALIQPTIARMTAATERMNLTAHEAADLAAAWFTGGDWLQPVLYLAQREDVRRAMPQRERLTAAVGARAEQIGNAKWLLGLLLVLDDEPLIVLHRATRRGYRMTIGGIGDNFQLHTLLAARLIGNRWRGKVPGRKPSAAMIAAATDGEIEPALPITGQFNLVDGYGQWIWNEGRPADIPLFHGVRVVVLDPPPYERSWNTGRAYPLMRPTAIVTAPLSRYDAEHWLTLVAPPATI
jgi:hypothetical protein